MNPDDDDRRDLDRRLESLRRDGLSGFDFHRRLFDSYALVLGVLTIVAVCQGFQMTDEAARNAPPLWYQVMAGLAPAGYVVFVLRRAARRAASNELGALLRSVGWLPPLLFTLLLFAIFHLGTGYGLEASLRHTLTTLGQFLLFTVVGLAIAMGITAIRVVIAVARKR